jgi:hypothetical protein
VIRLGLRLTLSGGREAAVRLAVIVTAVALGVGLLLSILAAINATATQNSRNAWLNTGSGTRTSSQSAAKADTDPLWWLLRADHFDSEIIGRVDVAATGPNSPVPAGLSRLPGPGEFYASPALSKLLHSTPAAELADRYPGHQVGTVGNAALPGPDSLIVVVGHRPDQLAKQHDATQVTTITTVTPSSCNGTNCTVRAGIDSRGIKLILSVAGTALIFPVLILIGTATRLAAARREQRFAAMRLVGATPRQISMLSAVESTVAAIVGTAVGFGLFYLFRTQLALVNLTRTPYFAGDLTLRTGDILLISVAVPVGAAIAARIALRRVQVSPLGVTRRATPRTILANTYPDRDVPWTVREDHAQSGAQLAGYQQLANVVILVSFPIAGCSLAVSVAGGLRDRKRPFSLLRLTGTQLGVLRRIVLLESAVPLLVVAVVAIGMGFLAAQLFVQAQFRYSIQAPGIQYYAIVLAGLVASLGVIASTMPLLRRITGPETARNE